MLRIALLVVSLTIAQQPAEKPPQTTPPAPKPAAPAGQTPAPKPPAQTPAQTPAAPRPAAAAARLSITVAVTDRQGKPIQNVTVAATGPMEREGTTDSEGTVILRNVATGTYRLRFDHQAYISFEKEVTVAAGRPVKTTAALTAAPPPPPPPPPPKPEPEPPPPASTAPSGPPTSVDIPTFVEKNYVGGSPSKTSQVGCTATATATLIQLRDPLAQHSHADADELIYVVAGEGLQRIGGVETNLTAGTLAVIPKGTPHTITRRGSRPVIMLSIVTGPPCTTAAK